MAIWLFIPIFGQKMAFFSKIIATKKYDIDPGLEVWCCLVATLGLAASETPFFNSSLQVDSREKRGRKNTD
jgi:hypothetical protein